MAVVGGIFDKVTWPDQAMLVINLFSGRQMGADNPGAISYRVI